MRLFYYPHAPYSRKVLLAAYEKDVACERELCLPFLAADKAKLKLAHPLATVPLLVDGDEIFTESSIMVERIDLVATAVPALVPSDPRAALRVRALDRFADAHLMGPTVYLAWSLRKDETGRNHEKIAAQRRVLDTAFGLLEVAIGDHVFVAGNALTMADLSPAAAISCLLSDGTVQDLMRWPNVARWYTAMIERQSFTKVLSECKTVPLPPGF